MAEYDPLALQYRRCKQAPYRTYVETPTFLSLVGQVRGAALDLACGEGFLTRILADLGASPVLGIDVSERMVGLARDSERAEPRGIRYECLKVEEMGGLGPFPLLTAGYLFNCAPSRESLKALWASIAANLAPGGRFVGLHGLLDRAGPVDLTPNGARVQHQGPLGEGEAYTIDFWDGDDWFSVVDFAWSLDTIAGLAREAGLDQVHWHAPVVGPEAPELAALPPLLTGLTARRP